MSPFIFWLLFAGNVAAGFWFAWLAFGPAGFALASALDVAAAVAVAACWRRYRRAAPVDRVRGGWTTTDFADVRWNIFCLPPVALTFGRWKQQPTARWFYVRAEWPEVAIRCGARCLVISPACA